MGRVPLQSVRVPQARSSRPLVPESPNASRYNAERRQGQAIGAGVQELGGAVAEYAQKHKNMDMEADQATFELFSKDRLTQAEMEAAKTANPDDVYKIYDAAEKDIEGYVTGKNQNGTANIRWKDQQQHISNVIMPMKGQIRAVAGDRVLSIYKADTLAKVNRIADDAVASGDVAGVKKAAGILRQSGIYTAEQVNAFEAEGERKIAANLETAAYNQTNSFLSQLDKQEEMGQITTSEKIQALGELEAKIGELPSKYQPLIEARIYSGQEKAYKKEKKELSDGFARILPGLESGIYKEDDLRYFLAGHSETYDQLMLVSKAARGALEGYKGKGAVELLNAVNFALAGKDSDGNVYTIEDASKALKDSKSKLAPIGLVMIGAAIMADDSGADPESVHNNWVIKEKKMTSGALRINPNSILGEGLSKLGTYIVDGDEESGWVGSTFAKMTNISKDIKLDDKEKREKINDLFKDRTRLLVEKVAAPQVRARVDSSAADKQAIAWANAHPEDPRAKQIKKKLGVK